MRYDHVAVTSTAVHDAVVAYRARLEDELPQRVRRVALFGSWARGEADEESDVDVLVVLSDASGAERARAIDAGGMIGLERDLVMAPLVLTESEWNELLRSERRLGREIERDGVAGVTRENRIANARAEIGSARDAVRVAEAALAIDVRRDAMSRAYYAVFHAARALLLLEGAEPKTHGGVSRMIGEQLVRAGKMDSKSALLVTRLQAYRQASDYSYAFAIDLDDARNELAHVRAFVEHAALAVEAAGGE